MKTPLTISKEAQRREANRRLESDEPTLLEHLVGLVSRSSSVDFIGAEKAITLRLPITLACQLDALVEVAGVSRNSMARDLLEYSIQDLIGELPQELADKVNGIANKSLVAEIGGKS